MLLFERLKQILCMLFHDGRDDVKRQCCSVGNALFTLYLLFQPESAALHFTLQLKLGILLKTFCGLKHVISTVRQVLTQMLESTEIVL